MGFLRSNGVQGRWVQPIAFFLAREAADAPYPEKVTQAQRCKLGLQQRSSRESWQG